MTKPNLDPHRHDPSPRAQLDKAVLRIKELEAKVKCLEDVTVSAYDWLLQCGDYLPLYAITALNLLKAIRPDQSEETTPMTDYPRTHPLFAMDERWIAECASVVIKSIDKMPHFAHTGQFPARGLVALVADHRRLEAELQKIAVELEWPGQDGNTLIDAVKDAASFGVLLCTSKASNYLLTERIAKLKEQIAMPMLAKAINERDDAQARVEELEADLRSVQHERTLAEVTASRLQIHVEELESTHPQMLDEDTHPWPKDSSEFEVIFRRPESVMVEWVEWEERWLTVDGHPINGEPEGWRPLSDQSGEQK